MTKFFPNKITPPPPKALQSPPKATQKPPKNHNPATTQPKKTKKTPPDFVTFLRSARNYLIISYDYFLFGWHDEN